MKQRLAVLCLAAIAAAAARAGTPLEEADKFYQNNEPVKARGLYEEALSADPANPMIYVRLGTVYEQLGDADKAIAILQRGLPYAGDYKPIFYLNMGDNYFRRGDLAQAEKMYGEAIALRETLPQPWLNRANSRVNLKNYQGALADYVMYLQVAPQSRQRPAVEEMIRRLTAFLQAKDAEERDRKEREKALMDQVLNALKNASEDARNLSSKSDKILEEKEEDIDIKQ